MSQLLTLNVPRAIVFSCICWIVLLPTLGPVFLLLWIYKQIVYLTLQIFRPDLELLSGSDSSLAESIHKNTLYNIGALFVLENVRNDQIDIEFVREDFIDKFLILNSKSGPLNERGREDEIIRKSGYRKLTKFYNSYAGHCFWEEDKNFAIDNHITECTISSVKELESFISNWIKSPYQKYKPMWGMVLIKFNSNSNKNCFAVALRIHHAMADGLSLLQMCNKMAGLDSLTSRKPKSIPIVLSAARVFILPHLLKNLIKKITAAPNPFSKVPATDDCCIVFTSVQLDDVRKIKRSMNVPFATILMTLVGSVLRRLLEDSKIPLPQYVNLGNALPWPHRPPDSLCNKWTFGVFKVPIADENLENRIRDTALDFSDYIKDGSHLVLKPFIDGLISLLPMGFLHWIIPLKDTVSVAPAPIMSGSLVGNLNKSYQMWGCDVKHVYPIACNAEPHLALASISTTHGNQMDISILVEKSVFPGLHDIKDNLAKYFEAEFQKLLLLSDTYVAYKEECREKLPD